MSDLHNSLATRVRLPQQCSSAGLSFAVHALLGLSLVLMMPRPTYGQANTDAVTDVGTTIHMSSSMVILDVLVENRKTGELTTDLQSTDFQLTEDGIPQAITYFSQGRLPLSVIFLFDLTDTVRSALKPLAGGAREMLGHLKPEDEVAILTFSSHTEVLQPFTTDRSLTETAIEKASTLQTKDGTFIHESMFEAVHQAMQSTTPGSRRVLIWLTDGSANSQNGMTQGMIGKESPAQLHTKEEATEVLLHSGVVVSALIERTTDTDLMLVNPFMRIVGVHMGDIRRYADLTGGPVLTTSKKDVAARLAELVDQLRLRYTIGYKPSAFRPDGTFCKLQLQLNAETLKGRTDASKMSVLTREGYYR